MNQGDKIKSFTDLVTWQEGHKLAIKIYKITKLFPREEMFGLVSQMRRCAVSITSNIAEGFSRYSYTDKARFYSISQGSVTELQNQLLIARDVNYVDSEHFNDIAKQSVLVHKLINGLIKKSKSILDS